MPFPRHVDGGCSLSIARMAISTLAMPARKRPVVQASCSQAFPLKAEPKKKAASTVGTAKIADRTLCPIRVDMAASPKWELAVIAASPVPQSQRSVMQALAEVVVLLGAQMCPRRAPCRAVDIAVVPHRGLTGGCAVGPSQAP